MSNRFGLTADRILVLVLSLCVIYLQLNPPPSRDCPKCASCPSCPICPSRARSTNTTQGKLSNLLGLLGSLPKGIVTNTDPSVFVATQYPSLTYLQLQQDMASYNILRHVSSSQTETTRSKLRVLDVGSAYCTFVIYAARLGFSTTAVEPDTEMHSSVEKSVKYNELEDLIHVERRYIFEAGTNVHNTAGRPVPTVTLNQLLLEKHVMARIDTHGVELLVLRSGLDAFRERRVENAIVHFTVQDAQVQSKMRPSGPAIVTKIMQFGYRVRILPGYCFAKLKNTLALDVEKKATVGFDVLLVTERDVYSAFEALPTLEGNNCPVWFALD